MNKLKPLKGKKFGCYAVVDNEIYKIKDKTSDHHRGHYLVECTCGRQRYIRSDTLLSGEAKRCRWCSNKIKYINLVNQKKISHKGYSVKHFGTGGLSKTWVLCHIINGARSRNIEFDRNVINTDYLWDLFLKQNRKCNLTGVELKMGTDVHNGCPVTKNGNPSTHMNNTASLDRIDNTRGYVEGNLQWIHKHINVMKLDHTQEDFINLCKQIVDYANQQPSIVKERKSNNEGSETRGMSSPNNNSLQERPTS